jgi:hypothetical protein
MLFFTCVVVTDFRYFLYDQELGIQKLKMTDDDLGSATVAHKLAPHKPRDRHTDNKEKVMIIDFYLTERVRRSELDVS